MLAIGVRSGANPVSLNNKIKNWLAAYAGVMLVATTFFGLYSLYIWLNINYTQVETMAYMAVAAFAISVFSISIIFGILYWKVQKLKKMKSKMVRTLEDGFILAEQEFGEPVVKNPKSAVAIASAAGYLIGERFL